MQSKCIDDTKETFNRSIDIIENDLKKGQSKENAS